MSRFLPGHGYVVDGHVTRAEAIEATRTALVDAGMDPLDADDDLVDQPGLVARAWWGGDEVGFVGEAVNGFCPAETPSGRRPSSPVTVVHVAVPE